MRATYTVRFIAATFIAGLGLGAQAAQDAATDFPNRPIEIVVPFPAGGTVDIIARAVVPHVTQGLGQQVVVINKPGAGGNIGTDQVAKSAPDGYRLVLGTSSTHVVNQYLYARLPFDPVKDFAPVILLTSVANVLVVNDSVNARNVNELITLARAQPGRLSYASFGNGTSPHLAGALFMQMAKINVVHVPYNGGPPALTDLLGGQVQMMFSNLPLALPHIKTGKLRALAVTGGQRQSDLPDVPTMSEAGVPGFKVEQQFALFAPAGTPAAIVQKLNTEFNRALKDAGVRQTLEKQGYNVIGGTSQDLADVMREESVKWKDVIKQSGARIE